MPEVKTTHPTVQQLYGYGLGKLPTAQLSAIHQHLVACPVCRTTFEKFFPNSTIGQLPATGRGGAQSPTLPPSASNTALPARKAAPGKTCDDVPAELAASSKFEILGKLGQGGMGSVYKARHTFLDELVAIKVMNADVVADPEARSRFLREMQAAGKLKHSNIVRALDAEQVGDLLVLVMELVPGITLEQLVKQRGALPVDFACQCIVQAAEGLQHAHEKGMVHRDIKPANLIVTPKDQAVKVLDFGLARGPREQNAKAKQTALETFMGTPEYVAPEQAMDARNADIRADVYSLGCTLYCLLAGRPPFQADSPMNTIIAQIQDEAPPLTELRPEVPAALGAVVAKMLAKKPADRYQTPREVAQALQLFVSGAKECKPAAAQPVARSTSASAAGLPSWLPPAPGPQEAKDSFAPAASTGSPRSTSRRRHGPAQGNDTGKWPAWTVYAAGVAASLVTTGLFGWLLLTLTTGQDRKPVAEASNQTTKQDTAPGSGNKPIPPAKEEKSPVVTAVTPAKEEKPPVVTSVTPAKEEKPPVVTGAGKGDQPPIPGPVTPIPPAKEEKPPVATPVPPTKEEEKPPVATPVPPAKEEKPPVATPVPPAAKFVSLFTGKDLTGWKIHPKPSNSITRVVPVTHEGKIDSYEGKLKDYKLVPLWRVEDGLLIGSGPRSHLYSERGDYKNFHFRVEAMIDARGASGQFVRTEFSPGFPKGGWVAQINAAHPNPIKTGSLYPAAGDLRKIPEILRDKAPHKPDEWFTQEVICKGATITILVNGKKTVEWTDPRDLHKSGHFALEQSIDGSEVKFRKIEVMELTETATAGKTPSGTGVPVVKKEESDDPLRRNIEKAKTAYDVACKKIDDALPIAIEKEIELTRKGKLNSDQKLLVIAILTEEKKAFEKHGLIPWYPRMRQAATGYLQVRLLAGKPLLQAYEKAQLQQIKAGNDKVAGEILAERNLKLATRVVARWDCTGIGFRGRWTFTLYANGRINNPEGRDFWLLFPDRIELHWPNPVAPKGVWIDKCVCTPNGQNFTAKNQKGRMFSGRVIRPTD